MKYLKSFCAIIMISLLLGCGTKDNTNKNNDTITDGGMELLPEPISDDMSQAKIENNFSVSAESKDGNILLFDAASEKELVSFEESYGSGNLFLSMTDENSGVLLYCSSPAAGQMMKQMYITKDRWQTYSQMDISSLIDGYPTSLSALSDTHLYIGAQMRSDGYLFETVDGGKNWTPVIIDEEIAKCRYGYAPISDNKEDIFYVLLECDGYYSLYQSDAALTEWKQAGTFTTEAEIESYFLWNGNVVITDIQGRYYQLTFDR